MDLVKFLTVSFILFLIAIWGIFFNRKNILVMLMSIELMILAVNLNFLFFSVALDDILGQIFALFILTVAAAESAIGLALLVVYYRVRGTVAVEFINLIKGSSLIILLLNRIKKNNYDCSSFNQLIKIVNNPV